ncbi:MAG: hypothetical protein HKN74_14580 [Acidimicrobiia bacterium]|nr:hypothetical protein [Acidimicrobiia bacterium]NNF11499.1 hypothetical protein [Acidimicrobiia bacterium]NNL68909.1 hypothetical protein [Acidimicrobiia bacterium]
MRRAALIGLLALAASACTFDVNVGIDLTRSGSGSVSIDVFTDEEFEELFRLTGQEFENLIASRGSQVGLAFTVVEGNRTQYSAASSQVAPETLRRIIEGLAPGAGTVTIDSSETTLEFDAAVEPLTSIPEVAELFEGADPAQFADDVTVTVQLTMPGEIETSTGSASGEALTWSIPFNDSGSRLLARSVLEKAGGEFPWVAAVGVGTLVVAIGFLIAIRSSLQRGEEATRTPLDLGAGPTGPTTPPEDQGVGLDNTPPEDQPIAPPLSD